MYDFRKFDKSGSPYKFLTFSFDDGVTQDRRLVELFNKYGLKGTFNLNSGYFGLKSVLETPSFKVGYDRIEPEELRELYSGHEVAVHTVRHPRLDLLTQDEVFHEVEDDRLRLEELSGQPIFGMAYPGGPFFNDEIINTIVTRTPIRYSRSTEGHHSLKMPEKLMEWEPSTHVHDDDVFDLAHKLIESKPEDDLLLYIWGHAYEFDIYQWWDKLEELCALLSGHDDITYATNGEIADYIMRNK